MVSFTIIEELGSAMTHPSFRNTIFAINGNLNITVDKSSFLILYFFK